MVHIERETETADIYSKHSLFNTGRIFSISAISEIYDAYIYCPYQDSFSDRINTKSIQLDTHLKKGRENKHKHGNILFSRKCKCVTYNCIKNMRMEGVKCWFISHNILFRCYFAFKDIQHHDDVREDKK